jgi:hypothetical protein
VGAGCECLAYAQLLPTESPDCRAWDALTLVHCSDLPDLQRDCICAPHAPLISRRPGGGASSPGCAPLSCEQRRHPRVRALPAIARRILPSQEAVDLGLVTEKNRSPDSARSRCLRPPPSRPKQSPISGVSGCRAGKEDIVAQLSLNPDGSPTKALDDFRKRKIRQRKDKG